MADISRSRTIAAQPQAIWDVLADFGSLSSWASNADHSCLLNHGPDGELTGTSRRVQMGRNVLVETVITCEPLTEIAYTVEGLPSRMGAITNRWTLRPAANETAVTLTSTVDIGDGIVAGVAERAICRIMAKQSESMLAGLAQRTEKAHV